MAVAAPVRHCGRCGARLPPGASFCGTCGTPVLLQAVAPPPVYRYSPAPPATYPTLGQAKLAPVLIAGVLIAVLIAVALVVGGIAVSQCARNSHPPCTVNCAPKFISPLPEEASFRSAAYDFQVNYSSRWTVRQKDANGITLGTRLGTVQVTGSKSTSADQALQATVAGLSTAKWQDVTLVKPLKGAHIGEVQGVGAVYSANLVGTSQTATRVRIGIIAATQHSVTVVVFASDPADTKNFPNGLAEGQEVDYLCTEFVWG